MRGDEYQELVDEIGALLGTPATLEDRDFRLIAFGAHEGAAPEAAVDPVRAHSILRRRSEPAVREWFEGFGIATAAGPVRVPAQPAAGVLTGRICLPARAGGVVRGYVWVLDNDPPAPRLAASMAVAGRIGALLAGEARAGARLGELLAAALAPGAPGASEELAAALGPAAGEPLALLAVTPWDAERPPPALPPGALALCAPRPLGAWAVPPAGGGRLAALARAAAARAVAGGLRGPGAVAGVAAARRGVAGLPAAWREAVAAARAARAERRFGGVAEWAALGPYRLLTALPGGAAPDPAVRALLRPENAPLARTAETFLDHAGHPGRAAEALGIHRQTLYYRLNRIARLTGLDLDRGPDRLLLHMSLKAARLDDGPA
ncbi:helix-turn-helix domain-containing protein [Streptomyces sp. DSM 44917]|uniref:Helix-turn-helix domain-containing protein n=1 Tax=Streptomyces boetiae TaxID=3075541 RepID=A0ABU2L9L7_9ACTN|nr:helix-turn-helix domain-containing protein [Streptomyces sp. DSM 44917]MDT0308260.1 helix-turn-helix domain-containing protein [Streptomyces sp. DSM 44917]